MSDWLIGVLLVLVSVTTDPIHTYFPVDEWDKAQCVRWYESRDVDTAVGLVGERGDFQIHPVHAWRFERHGWTWADAFNEERNTAIAAEIWREQGWGPWSTESLC